MLRVFISSTIKDFSGLRAKLFSLLRKYEYDIFASEFEGPKWKNSATECLDQISACDIFVGIYGSYYGFVPEPTIYRGLTDIFDGNVSVTHGEYLYARRINKPMLIYVKNVPTEDKRQEALVKQVKDFYEGYFCHKFNDDNELLTHIPEHLSDLVTKLVRGNYRYPSINPPKIILCNSWNEVADAGAQRMLEVVQNTDTPCLSLTSGRTASAVYRSFIELYSRGDFGDLFRNVELFSNNEYFGVTGSNPRSIQSFLTKSFLSIMEKKMGKNLLWEEKIHFLSGVIKDGGLEDHLTKYDVLVGQSVINLQILGTCPKGTTLFVEPSSLSQHELLEQRTSFIRISDYSYNYAFPKPVSKYAITIGIGNVLSRSQEIMLLLFGVEKADIARKMLLTKDMTNPTIALRTHKNLVIVLDTEAASKLPQGWQDRFDVTSFRDLKPKK